MAGDPRNRDLGAWLKRRRLRRGRDADCVSIDELRTAREAAVTADDDDDEGKEPCGRSSQLAHRLLMRAAGVAANLAKDGRFRTNAKSDTKACWTVFGGSEAYGNQTQTYQNSIGIGGRVNCRKKIVARRRKRCAAHH